MSGVSLRQLPACDTIDVLHFMFEDSLNYSTADQQNASQTTRKMIYESLYEREYPYYTGDAGSQSMSEQSASMHDTFPSGGLVSNEDRMPRPFDPAKAPPKPYISPTPLNPSAVNPYGLKEEPLN